MNRLSQTLLTTTAISCMAFSALANPITGSVEVELKEIRPTNGLQLLP